VKISIANQVELNRSLDEFNKLDWDSITESNIEEKIPKALKAMMVYSIEYPSGNYIYRARAFDTFPKDINDPQDNFLLPSSFSYPPVCKARISRANFEGQQVFYGASNLMLAIVEAKSIGELDFIGCWKIKPGETMRIRPFFSNIPNEFLVSNNLLFNRINQQYENILTQQFPLQKEIIKQLDNFHDRQFTKTINNPKEYLYTAWLANKNFKTYIDSRSVQHPSVNAVMFQSTKHHGIGTNMAISKDFADKALVLEEIYLISHHRKDEQSFNRFVHASGKIDNGKIIWRVPTTEDQDRFAEVHNIPIFAREQQ
jgi:hypothetical protein